MDIIEIGSLEAKNDNVRFVFQLRQEKVQLEHTLEQEQECLVNKLMRRIEKLETETTSKQVCSQTLSLFLTKYKC